MKLNLPPKPAPGPKSASTPASEAESASVPVSPPDDPTVTKPEWERLLDDSQYAKALELAPGDFDKAVWHGGANDLLGLGAAARHVNDGRARRIYRIVRSRFSGTDAAANAAFMLARMDFHGGASQSSAAWLQTYLRERPRGRFARDAAGRLIEAYRQSNDAVRAKSAAQAYLARYQDGPHAALARTVLE